LSANRKSYMPRQLAQQRMTLGDLERLFHIIRITHYLCSSWASCNVTGDCRLSTDVQDFKSSFKMCVSQGLRSVTQVRLLIVTVSLTGTPTDCHSFTHSFIYSLFRLFVHTILYSITHSL